MQTSRLSKAMLIALTMTVVGASVSSAASQTVRGGFLYNLADFTGPLRDNFSRVASDKERNEIYVLYQNAVTVFNDSGMQIHRFGDDLDVGQIVDVAVDREGDIFLLTFQDSRSAIVRCNYRGEPKSVRALQNFPETFSDFNPNRMIYRQGSFYLASLFAMKLAIVDLEGNFKNGYDLLPLFDLEEKDRGTLEVSGFYVDADGSIVVTVPALFRAFILSPDGTLTWFGKPGGAPGRFNIVAGIARDKRGNYLVVDRLKGSVLVFDKSFNFVTQFAVRGYRPGELIFPNDIVTDNNDRIYVTQMGKRGVSVYRLTYN